MADQNNNQQHMAPVDPFSFLMWGPPPGFNPYQAMPQPPQYQGQGPNNQSMPNFSNGGFDFNKLMDSADKMVKLINQTQPMLKQLGPLFNMFKQS
ncbi:MAG: YppG family protein [Tuberibacillus sp.]